MSFDARRYTFHQDLCQHEAVFTEHSVQCPAGGSVNLDIGCYILILVVIYLSYNEWNFAGRTERISIFLLSDNYLKNKSNEKGPPQTEGKEER